MSSPFNTSSSSFEYDVFLSFRGKDTRNGFTGHLFEALKHKGVRTFMDDEGLEIGKRIDENLWRAIERSAVCIVILSEHYAESQWCLKELAMMFHYNKTIFPVFYQVNPSDVRRQKGLYEKAFCDYEKRCCLHPDDEEHIKEEEVRKWKDALTEVGNRKGFHLDKQYNGEKPQQLIQIIVEKVLNEHKLKHPVGIERGVDKMMELLDIEAEDVRMIGICGMGGIGKSTLAKVIYNRISGKFDAVCIISNIREAAGQRNGLVKLQKQLIYEIAKIDDPAIDDADDGATEIRQRCRFKKVLIILDDVDKNDQLNKLAGERDWFEKGSRVIITTRDEHVLNVHRVKDHEIYRPEEMNPEESLELFSWYAFGRSQPLDPFMEISREVVRVAGGLPLALEVLGSELFDKTEKGQWEEMLEKLRRVPHTSIEERLKISYDGLDQEEKTIFLDIACLFIGEQREYVTDVLKACGFASNLTIQVLLHKSLLKIDEDNRLVMHDQLRDMGRNIANRSRIWDADDALNDPKGSQNIEGLLIDTTKSLSTEAFTKMSSLRLLRLNYVNLEGDFSKMPESLRWLEWHDCPLGSLPKEFDLKQIGFLDLSGSKMVGLWDEGNECGNKVFHGLRVLKLQNCIELQKSPDFDRLPNLQKLSLRGCEKLVSLDESIGSLTKLIVFDLSYCKALTHLPDSICNMKKLRELNLYETKIRELPLTIGSLHNLEKLFLSSCYSLSSLPDSIGNSNKLRELNLEGTKIREMPLSIGSLHNFEELFLYDCDRLRSLPDSIGNLNKLCELNLSGTKIRELPLSIGSLHNLEDLSLYGCDRLRSLPDSIGNLNKICYLDLSGTKIRELPLSIGSLHSLEKLILSGCDRLRSLPDSIGNLNKLRKLDLEGTKIRELPLSIGSLHNLEELSLSGCDMLRSLPDSIGNLNKLRYLDLEGTKIGELPLSIGSLHNLELLFLSGCDRLRSLPDSIENLNKLRELDLRKTKIRVLPPSIGALQNLEGFYVTGCHRLRSLPDSIWNLTKLKRLELGGCDSLRVLPDPIGDLKSTPESVGALTEIEELQFHNCRSLRALPNSIGIMKSLVSITISEASIEELPDSIGSLLNLKILEMTCCPRLRRLPDSIGGLTKLETLILSGCKQISALPHSLGDLVNLKEVSLDRTHIKELPRSIVSLEKLEKLDIHGTKLTTPLPLWELKSLYRLSVWDIDGEEEEVDLENKIESDDEEYPEEGEESAEESNEGEDGEESTEESNEGEEGEEFAEETNEGEEVLISGYSKKTREYRKIYRQFLSSYYWKLLVRVGNQERYIHLVLDQQDYRMPEGRKGWKKLIFPSDFILESISSVSDGRDIAPPSTLEANAHAAACCERCGVIIQKH